MQYRFAPRIARVLFAALVALPLLGASSLSRAAGTQSISHWVSCTESQNDIEGVAQAFAAASHGAFTLVVDCPVNVKIGSDIGQIVFIDNGTSVEFTSSGKFIVDNAFIPTFVIANSSAITLTNWQVEYEGGISVEQGTSYLDNGKLGEGKPGNAFSDIALTQWLTAHRQVKFNNEYGAVKAQWSGTTNACAVFFITGDSYDIAVTGMHLYVPSTAGGSNFIPVAFTSSLNYKSGQTVTARTPVTAQYVAVPHDLTFENITFDGTYMGWVGGLQDAVFENIASLRYSDLQDSGGNNVGGVGKWFAPPHLFYLKPQVDDLAALSNSNIQIKNVTDKGPRAGHARDAGGKDSISGYANSLKLGCTDCSVDTYTSNRPDGLMDILNSNGLTVSNVIANYDSGFTHQMYPAWRFPDSSYKNMKFENVTVTDAAESTTANPISNSTQNAQGIVLSNVEVVMHKWDRPSRPFPTIGGSGNLISLGYFESNSTTRYVQSVNDKLEVELSASQSSAQTGQTTTIPWQARSANSCTGSGSLAGSSGTHGVRSQKLDAVGQYIFVLECRNAFQSASATLDVSVDK
jgi:hypothetical protein